MQMFSLPFLFTSKKENEEERGENHDRQGQDDYSCSSSSSDESDSRFMTEQETTGHSTSFIALHPHHRVQQLEKVLYNHPSQLPAHIHPKANYDDVSMLSFEYESSTVFSGNSSVELNPNPYGTSSKADIAMRWKQNNKNIDLIKKKTMLASVAEADPPASASGSANASGDNNIDSYVSAFTPSSTPADLDSRLAEALNSYVSFHDAMHNAEMNKARNNDHDNAATPSRPGSTGGNVGMAQSSGVDTGMLQKTLRSASASAVGSPPLSMEKKSSPSPLLLKNAQKRRSKSEQPQRRAEFPGFSQGAGAHLDGKNLRHTHKFMDDTQIAPPPPPPILKKKYSGSQFQISPRLTMIKSTSTTAPVKLDHPQLEAQARFSVKLKPLSGSEKPNNVRLFLGSDRSPSSSANELPGLGPGPGQSRNFSTDELPWPSAGEDMSYSTPDAYHSNSIRFPSPKKKSRSMQDFFVSTPPPIEIDGGTKNQQGNLSYSTPKTGKAKILVDRTPSKLNARPLRSVAAPEYISDSDSDSNSAGVKPPLPQLNGYSPNRSPCRISKSCKSSTFAPKKSPFLERLAGMQGFRAEKDKCKSPTEKCTGEPSVRMALFMEPMQGIGEKMDKCKSSAENCSGEEPRVRMASLMEPMQGIGNEMDTCKTFTETFPGEARLRMGSLQEPTLDHSSVTQGLSAVQNRTRKWMHQMWSPECNEWDYINDVNSSNSVKESPISKLVKSIPNVNTTHSPIESTPKVDTTQSLTDNEEDSLIHALDKADDESLEDALNEEGEKVLFEGNLDKSEFFGAFQELGSPLQGTKLEEATTLDARIGIAHLEPPKNSNSSDSSMGHSVSAASARRSSKKEANALVLSQPISLSRSGRKHQLSCSDKNECGSTMSYYEVTRMNIRKAAVKNVSFLTNPERIAAVKIQSAFRGMRSRYETLQMLGVAKRKRWEDRTKSYLVTKIHSKFRRSARDLLRSRYDNSTEEVFIVSMAVSVRHVCASIIQTWWKHRSGRLSCKDEEGFDSAANFPSSWNKTETDSIASAVESFFPEDSPARSTRRNRPSSRSAESDQTSTTNSTQSGRFNVGYYNKSHADLYEEEADVSLKLDNEDYEVSVSLLRKMHHGIIGRFVKIFKKKPRGNKPIKKEKKLRLKKLFKRGKKKESSPPPLMLGDPEVNAELPDPLSLYQPLEEEEEKCETAMIESEPNETMKNLGENEHPTEETGEDTTQWTFPSNGDSFSLMAGSFATFPEMSEPIIYPQFEPSDNESSIFENDEYQSPPTSPMRHSDIALIKSLTYESVPFDER